MNKASHIYKIIAAFTALCVEITSLSIPLARAEVIPQSSPSIKQINPELLKLPNRFGEVVESHAGNGSVIVIQDAHAIPDAQRNIANIIKHLQREYGVGTVALEGASGDLDPQIFRSFPDKKLLREVMKSYMDAGEIAGGTAAAIFDETATKYQGIEDWDIYEEGLGLYLSAMEKEALLLEMLSAKRLALNAEKEKVYSKELLGIDQAVEKFYENAAQLTDLIKVLGAAQAPQAGSELEALWKEVSKQNNPSASYGQAGDKSQSKDVEVRELARKVEKVLKSPGAVKVFNSRKQEWMTGEISAEAFAMHLQQWADQSGLSLEMSSDLLGMVRDQQTLKGLEGTKLFRDLEIYIQSVKAKLIDGQSSAASAGMRALDERTESLRLITRLTKLELPRQEWSELSKGKVFEALSALEINQDDLVFHLAFYLNAEERDQIFFENLTRSEPRLPSSNVRIIVAGGFHAEGITTRLKEAGMGYALVMPKINHIPESLNYRSQMRGEVSWKDYFEVENGRIHLYKAFVRATRDNLLSRTQSLDPGDKDGINLNLLKAWRDQIIRDLSDMGKVDRAAWYTRYMDEVIDPTIDQRLKTNDKLMMKVDGFIRGLRGLEKTNQLTSDQIAALLKANMIAPKNSVALVPGALSPVVDSVSTEVALGIVAAGLGVQAEGELPIAVSVPAAKLISKKLERITDQGSKQELILYEDGTFELTQDGLENPLRAGRIFQVGRTQIALFHENREYLDVQSSMINFAPVSTDSPVGIDTFLNMDYEALTGEGILETLQPVAENILKLEGLADLIVVQAESGEKSDKSKQRGRVYRALLKRFEVPFEDIEDAVIRVSRQNLETLVTKLSARSEARDESERLGEWMGEYAKILGEYNFAGHDENTFREFNSIFLDALPNLDFSAYTAEQKLGLLVKAAFDIWLKSKSDDSPLTQFAISLAQATSGYFISTVQKHETLKSVVAGIEMEFRDFQNAAAEFQKRNKPDSFLGLFQNILADQAEKHQEAIRENLSIHRRSLLNRSSPVALDTSLDALESIISLLMSSRSAELASEILGRPEVGNTSDSPLTLQASTLYARLFSSLAELYQDEAFDLSDQQSMRILNLMKVLFSSANRTGWLDAVATYYLSETAENAERKTNLKAQTRFRNLLALILSRVSETELRKVAGGEAVLAAYLASFEDFVALPAESLGDRSREGERSRAIDSILGAALLEKYPEQLFKKMTELAGRETNFTLIKYGSDVLITLLKRNRELNSKFALHLIDSFGQEIPMELRGDIANLFKDARVMEPIVKHWVKGEFDEINTALKSQMSAAILARSDEAYQRHYASYLKQKKSMSAEAVISTRPVAYDEIGNKLSPDWFKSNDPLSAYEKQNIRVVLEPADETDHVRLPLLPDEIQDWVVFLSLKEIHRVSTDPSEMDAANQRNRRMAETEQDAKMGVTYIHALPILVKDSDGAVVNTLHDVIDRQAKFASLFIDGANIGRDVIHTSKVENLEPSKLGAILDGVQAGNAGGYGQDGVLSSKGRIVLGFSGEVLSQNNMFKTSLHPLAQSESSVKDTRLFFVGIPATSLSAVWIDYPNEKNGSETLLELTIRPMIERNFYVPVYDMKSGEILFKPEMFDARRSAYDEKVLSIKSVINEKAQADNSSELLAAISKIPGVEQVDPFAKSAGVGEMLTLGQHTLLAMGQLNKILSHRRDNQLNLPSSVSEALMRILLALHDIGKPAAIRGSRSQHKSTMDMLNQHIFPYLPLNDSEINILKELIDGDPLGDYIKEPNEGSLDRAAKDIQAKADKLGMDVNEFLELLTLYYQSDASSYTSAADSQLLNSINIFDFKIANGSTDISFEAGRFAFNEATEIHYEALAAKVKSVVAPRRSELRTEVAPGVDQFETQGGTAVSIGMATQKDDRVSGRKQPHLLLLDLDQSNFVQKGESHLFHALFFSQLFHKFGVNGVPRSYKEIQDAVAAAKASLKNAAGLNIYAAQANLEKAQNDKAAFLKEAQKQGFEEFLLKGDYGILSRRLYIAVPTEEQRQRVLRSLMLTFAGQDKDSLRSSILKAQEMSGVARYSEADLEAILGEFEKARSFTFPGGVFHGLSNDAMLKKLGEFIQVQAVDTQKLNFNPTSEIGRDISISYDSEGFHVIEGQNEMVVGSAVFSGADEKVPEWGISLESQLRKALAFNDGIMRTVNLGTGDPTDFSGAQDYTHMAFVKNGKFVLADPSIRTIRNLERLGLMDQVSAIQLTHVHYDHVGGLLDLIRRKVKAGESEPPIKLLAPYAAYAQLVDLAALNFGEELRDSIAGIFDFRAPAQIASKVETVEFEGMTFQFGRTHGHPIPTYGVKITNNGITTSYLSDSTMPPQKIKDADGKEIDNPRYQEFVEFFGGTQEDPVDMLVAENGVPGVHITPEQLAKAFPQHAQLGLIYTVHSAGPQTQKGLIRFMPGITLEPVKFAERKQNVQIVGQRLLETEAIKELLPLTEEEAQELAALGTVTSYDRGETLIREGDFVADHDHVLITLSGETLVESSTGFSIDPLGPGHVLGEMALLTKSFTQEQYDQIMKSTTGDENAVSRNFFGKYTYDIFVSNRLYRIIDPSVNLEKEAEVLDEKQKSNLKLLFEISKNGSVVPRTATIKAGVNASYLAIPKDAFLQFLSRVDTSKIHPNRKGLVFAIKGLIAENLEFLRILAEESTLQGGETEVELKIEPIATDPLKRSEARDAITSEKFLELLRKIQSIETQLLEIAGSEKPADELLEEMAMFVLLFNISLMALDENESQRLKIMSHSLKRIFQNSKIRQAALITLDQVLNPEAHERVFIQIIENIASYGLGEAKDIDVWNKLDSISRNRTRYDGAIIRAVENAFSRLQQGEFRSVIPSQADDIATVELSIGNRSEARSADSGQARDSYERYKLLSGTLADFPDPVFVNDGETITLRIPYDEVEGSQPEPDLLVVFKKINGKVFFAHLESFSDLSLLEEYYRSADPLQEGSRIKWEEVNETSEVEIIGREEEMDSEGTKVKIVFSEQGFMITNASISDVYYFEGKPGPEIIASYLADRLANEDRPDAVETKTRGPVISFGQDITEMFNSVNDFDRKKFYVSAAAETSFYAAVRKLIGEIVRKTNETYQYNPFNRADGLAPVYNSLFNFLMNRFTKLDPLNMQTSLEQIPNLENFVLLLNQLEQAYKDVFLQLDEPIYSSNSKAKEYKDRVAGVLEDIREIISIHEAMRLSHAASELQTQSRADKMIHMAKVPRRGGFSELLADNGDVIPLWAIQYIYLPDGGIVSFDAVSQSKGEDGEYERLLRTQEVRNVFEELPQGTNVNFTLQEDVNLKYFMKRFLTAEIYDVITVTYPEGFEDKTYSKLPDGQALPRRNNIVAVSVDGVIRSLYDLNRLLPEGGLAGKTVTFFNQAGGNFDIKKEIADLENKFDGYVYSRFRNWSNVEALNTYSSGQGTQEIVKKDMLDIFVELYSRGVLFLRQVGFPVSAVIHHFLVQAIDAQRVSNWNSEGKVPLLEVVMEDESTMMFSGLNPALIHDDAVRIEKLLSEIKGGLGVVSLRIVLDQAGPAANSNKEGQFFDRPGRGLDEFNAWHKLSDVLGLFLLSAGEIGKDKKLDAASKQKLLDKLAVLVEAIAMIHPSVTGSEIYHTLYAVMDASTFRAKKLDTASRINVLINLARQIRAAAPQDPQQSIYVQGEFESKLKTPNLDLNELAKETARSEARSLNSGQAREAEAVAADVFGFFKSPADYSAEQINTLADEIDALADKQGLDFFVNLMRSMAQDLAALSIRGSENILSKEATSFAVKIFVGRMMAEKRQSTLIDAKIEKPTVAIALKLNDAQKASLGDKLSSELAEILGAVQVEAKDFKELGALFKRVGVLVTTIDPDLANAVVLESFGADWSDLPAVGVLEETQQFDSELEGVRVYLQLLIAAYLARSFPDKKVNLTAEVVGEINKLLFQSDAGQEGIVQIQNGQLVVKRSSLLAYIQTLFAAQSAVAVAA